MKCFKFCIKFMSNVKRVVLIVRKLVINALKKNFPYVN